MKHYNKFYNNISGILYFCISFLVMCATYIKENVSSCNYLSLPEFNTGICFIRQDLLESVGKDVSISLENENMMKICNKTYKYIKLNPGEYKFRFFVEEDTMLFSSDTFAISVKQNDIKYYIIREKLHIDKNQISFSPFNISMQSAKDIVETFK